MINVKEISKTFEGTKVLDDFSCQISKGEIVSILGPSGSGKSTLLRCLNLLVIPDSGTIMISKEEITAKKFIKKSCNIQKLRQHVGMVFQHFHLFPHLSVLENVIYGPIYGKGETKKIVVERAQFLLERVGLSDKVDARPHTLSGGQKQRVAIARCLAMQPDIILFDEPTSALDPEMVKEVLNVIQSLFTTGITILIVTHEMAFARDVSNTIMFMDKGRLLEQSTPSAFFSHPQTERAKTFLDKVL